MNSRIQNIYFTNMVGMVFISILAFSGILVSLFPYGEMVQKILIAGLSLLFIIMRYQNAFPKQAVVFISLLLFYVLFSAISSLYYFSSVVYVLASLQSLLLCIIIYLWASGFRLKQCGYGSLRKLAYIIIIAQVIFSLIKLYVHGVDEKFLIGTMSHSAGQLGFLFPAIVIPLLIFLMKDNNRGLIFTLIAAMFIFSVINEKRSAIYLLPFIILFSFLYIQSGNQGSFLNGKNLWKIMTGGAIGIVGTVIGLSMIPSLNIEGTYGGSISIVHAFNYAISYLTMDYGSALQGSYAEAANNTGIQVGRVTLLLHIVNWLLFSDIQTMFFGLGYGSVTPSSWAHDNRDILFSTIGTRGAMSGFGLALLETGLFGAGLISGFFVYCFWKLRTEYRKLRSSLAKRWFRMLLIVFCVFCFDFFFYSIVLLRTMPMPFLFSGAIASIFIVKRIDKDLFLREKTLVFYSR